MGARPEGVIRWKPTKCRSDKSVIGKVALWNQVPAESCGVANNRAVSTNQRPKQALQISSKLKMFEVFSLARRKQSSLMKQQAVSLVFIPLVFTPHTSPKKRGSNSSGCGVTALAATQQQSKLALPGMNVSSRNARRY